MKKEKLIELGLAEETAEKVMKMLAEELKGFVPHERFNEVNEVKKKLETEIAERDAQLENLKKSAKDVDELKSKINELQTLNTESKAKYEAEVKSIKIDNAVKTALSNAKARNSAVVVPLLAEFLKTAEIDENGKVKGLDKEVEKLVKDENSSFLFEVESQPQLKGLTPFSNPDNVNNQTISNGAMYAQKYNSQFIKE